MRKKNEVLPFLVAIPFYGFLVWSFLMLTGACGYIPSWPFGAC